jgi:mediator of RNA polymerase II transcription subunit 21
MADRLTQLQDALDNVCATRLPRVNGSLTHRQQYKLMYQAITYIQNRHPYGDIPGQPPQQPQSQLPSSSAPNSAAPQSAVTNGDGVTQQQANGASQQQRKQEPPGTPPPESLNVFNDALHEFAKLLVLQEQQIEILVQNLPGLGNSEEKQLRRMKELEAELKEVEQERAEAEKEREEMVDVLGEVISGIKRVP